MYCKLGRCTLYLFIYCFSLSLSFFSLQLHPPKRIFVIYLHQLTTTCRAWIREKKKKNYWRSSVEMATSVGLLNQAAFLQQHINKPLNWRLRFFFYSTGCISSSIMGKNAKWMVRSLLLSGLCFFCLNPSAGLITNTQEQMERRKHNERSYRGVKIASAMTRLLLSC